MANTITVAILCGMTSERECLHAAFARYPNVAIYSGEDRLFLPRLVPTTVTRIIDMGLGGGLGPPDPHGYVLQVPDVVSATTLSDKRGDLIDVDSLWMDHAIQHAHSAGTDVHKMPYYSDGEFNESNMKAQREHIHAISANHALAMSDETRFAAALAQRRGIEFGVWRVMSDVWPTTLPPAARGAILNSDGSVNIIDLATSLATDPEQIQALIKLAKDGIASIEALGKSASAAAAVLADPTT
jgi:hypothetical protein